MHKKEYIPFKRAVYKKILWAKESKRIERNYKNEVFSGCMVFNDINREGLQMYVKGVAWGSQFVKRKNGEKYMLNAADDVINGYSLACNKNEVTFVVRDMGVEIEYQSFHSGESSYFDLGIEEKDVDVKKVLRENQDVFSEMRAYNFNPDWTDLSDLMGDIFGAKGNEKDKQRAQKTVWAYERLQKMERGIYVGENDILPYYVLQNKLKERVVQQNELPDNVKHIAGVEVAYNELDKRMVGAIVVLDVKTFNVVDHAWHEMDITFPYLPGLFSFREVPAALEAFKKLNAKPDLLVCNAQGIAHPKGVGLATHLGIELNIPAIGCARKRIVGVYDKDALGIQRGSQQFLTWNGEKVGAALRTQSNARPMFVSIGHKIDLETAISWVLKLATSERLPKATQEVEQLVSKLLKSKTQIDLLGDDIMIFPPALK